MTGSVDTPSRIFEKIAKNDVTGTEKHIYVK